MSRRMGHAAAAALAAVTYVETIKPVVDEHCVPCHRGIFNLTDFPFAGSSWPTQEQTVAAFVERMRRTDWKRMPPPRVAPDPLPEETIALFEEWLAAGLPRD